MQKTYLSLRGMGIPHGMYHLVSPQLELLTGTIMKEGNACLPDQEPLSLHQPTDRVSPTFPHRPHGLPVHGT